jgi:putative addiction module component (TIGR02574 family)
MAPFFQNRRVRDVGGKLLVFQHPGQHSFSVGFGLERETVLSDSCVMVVEKIPQLKNLSSEEKLILVGELWDQLAANPEAFPKREDHVKLLEERLAHFRDHPDDVIAWEEVKKRILSSR